MNTILSKGSILKKTIEVGSSTLMSRILGIIREMLQVMYLGVGIGSDAFFTAYKIPNSLRKIFAEGALSAAFIPTLVQVAHQDKKKANNLMSLAFIIFEGLVLLLCFIVIWKAQWVVECIAPGFSTEAVALTVPLVRILMPFIFFISSSALLAGSLQSVGHFFVPAFSPVLLNIFYISGLIASIYYKLDVLYLCLFIMIGGLVQCIGHLIAYINLGFSFGSIDHAAWKTFASIGIKFFLVAISMSIVEINLFIDTSFASFLSAGSLSLIYYANRFMNIPLGVFAVAFSTILLPYFSRITTYAPKRLSFYLLEAAKFIFWVTIPVALFMAFFSEKIFSTLFLSNKFTMNQAIEAGHILIAFLIGLFFFSINKILLNIYYALHVTLTPALISAGTTALNIIFVYSCTNYLQATGLALATSLSGIMQTLLFLYFLRKQFNFVLYGKSFMEFFCYYSLQLAFIGGITIASYYGIESLIHAFCIGSIKNFLLYSYGFWLWVMPLSGLVFLALFYSRKLFNVNLYFLD